MSGKNTNCCLQPPADPGLTGYRTFLVRARSPEHVAALCFVLPPKSDTSSQHATLPSAGHAPSSGGLGLIQGGAQQAQGEGRGVGHEGAQQARVPQPSGPAATGDARQSGVRVRLKQGVPLLWEEDLKFGWGFEAARAVEGVREGGVGGPVVLGCSLAADGSQDSLGCRQ